LPLVYLQAGVNLACAARGADTAALVLPPHAAAALLVLGVTVLLTGTALGTLVMSFVRRPQGLQSTARRTT